MLDRCTWVQDSAFAPSSFSGAVLASDPIFDSVSGCAAYGGATPGPLRFHGICHGAFACDRSIRCTLFARGVSQCVTQHSTWGLDARPSSRVGPLLDNLVYMEYANDSSTPCTLFASKASKLPIAEQVDLESTSKLSIIQARHLYSSGSPKISKCIL